MSDALACADMQGTKAGYQRHWRAQQEACRACKDANNAYNAGHRTPPDTSRDQVAIEEAVAGRRVTLTRAELAEVHRRLKALGLSVAQAAARLDCSGRTVQRWRSRLAAADRELGDQDQVEDLEQAS